jgi:hypothetical protein
MDIANAMPSSDNYAGLTRTVLQYSEAFSRVIAKARAGKLTDADWEPFEQLVDTAAYIREGVFLGPQAEVIDWPTYQGYIAQYGGFTTWDGTLRHVTETPGRVILELEERNTHDGVTHVSNTVTIYEFNDAGKLRHLDVYVMPLG